MILTSTFARWRAFVSGSPLRRLGLDALIAATTSVAVRVISFAKEIMVAAHFGLSGNLDVYLVAFTLIGFPLAILLNAVQTVFMVKLSADISREETKQLYGLTALGTVLMLSTMLPLWLLLVPHALPWLASSFPSEKRIALETALLWLIPYYFLNGLNLLGYGVLQAKRCYFKNGLFPAATPIVIMGGLIIFGGTDDWQLLAATLVAGAAVEWALLILTLLRMGCIGMPRLSELKTIKPIFSESLALLPSTAVGACVSLVGQAIAASLTEGSNAALAYGYRFPGALQSVLMTAIGITALPYFASQIARRQGEYCLHSLKKLFWTLGVGGIIITLPLVVFSHEITVRFYQRGAFDAEAASRVVPIQTAYFVQIPFALLGILGIKTLAALGRNVQVSVITATGGILQCIMAYALARQIGVAGIAWAATLISASIATASFLAAQASLRRLTP